METFFLICAAVGGTFLVLQVALSLLGFGGELFGDLGHVDGHLGGHHHVGHAGHSADVGPGDHPADGHDHGLSWLGKWLTIQTIVAFVTFFGVGGLSARGVGWPSWASVATAVSTGVAATVLLAYVFGGLSRLQGSGTLRLAEAVGLAGRVYLRVPGNNGGAGKVTLPIQGRTEELRAVTSGPELRFGEPVVVTRVLDDQTIEVVAQAAYVDKSASLAD